MTHLTLLAAAALMALPFHPRLGPPLRLQQLPKPISVPNPPEVPHGLAVPVEGVKASQLSDTFKDSRSGGRPHDAIDIMAARGTPVIAVDDGPVVKLFKSVAGGITVYQFNEDKTYGYYYAHLDRYAEGLVEGRALKRGDLIGYVGFTGNANPSAPHLHFAIFVLGPEKHWWQGDAVNPYPLLGGR